MSIKIEDGIPVPVKGAKGSRYPIGQLEIGQSFFVPDVTHANVSGFLSIHRKKGKNFTCRKATVDGVPGIRVWRIA